jgi:hypothetical protein
MKLAHIVCFHRYEPFARENYRHLFNFWLHYYKKIAHHIDHLYLIDSGWGITESQYEELCQIIPNRNVTLTVKPPTSHWQNMNEAIREVKEDSFLITDSDTIIYDEAPIVTTKEMLVKTEIVSCLDNSGGRDLENTYAMLAANENRSYRRRFTPYFFACQTNLFHRIPNFDFTPTGGDNWTDSMGTVTEQLLRLNPSFYELRDERKSVALMDGIPQVVSAFESPPHEWAKTDLPDTGFYHLRNAGGGHNLAETYVTQPDVFAATKKIMPVYEAVRLLYWWKTITHRERMINPEYDHEIKGVLHEFATPDQIMEYESIFMHLHPWIGEYA